MTRRRSFPRPGPWAALGTLLLLGLAASGVPASARGPAAGVPLADDARFVTELSAPILAPGGSGSITLRLADPMPGALSDVVLRLAEYAFSAAPGGSSGAVPAGALTVGGASGNGSGLELSYASLAPGASPVGISVPVDASGSAPSGGYAVRLALTFTENGTGFRLESRGFFSDAAWRAAALPNGSDGAPGLNLSRLGVDGVLPETAVGVSEDPWTGPVELLAAGGIALAGVGSFLYFRKGPGSRSGARTPASPQRAESAVGK